MSIIKSFNSTIDYIETVFEDEIDEMKITHLSGYSSLTRSSTSRVCSQF